MSIRIRDGAIIITAAREKNGEISITVRRFDEDDSLTVRISAGGAMILEKTLQLLAHAGRGKEGDDELRRIIRMRQRSHDSGKL